MKFWEKRKRKDRVLVRLQGDQEAAARLLSRELGKRGVDWDRAGVLAEVSNETLKDLMDYKDGPGSYDRFIQRLCGRSR